MKAGEPRIAVDRAQIAGVSQRWRIREFARFDPVLRDGFRPDSDVALERLFGRHADLHQRPAVEWSRRPLRRRGILDGARVVYAA